MAKEIKQPKNGWKTFAIILMIVFIIENAALAALVDMSMKMMDEKDKCGNVVCEDMNATSFSYDYFTKECGCYMADGSFYKETFK